MRYECKCNGLYSIVLEATCEAQAVELYEIERGLVKGINPVTANPLDESPESDVASPFGLTRSDRYEPFVEAKPAEKPLAAVSVSEGEEVLVIE